MSDTQPFAETAAELLDSAWQGALANAGACEQLRRAVDQVREAAAAAGDAGQFPHDETLKAVDTIDAIRAHLVPWTMSLSGLRAALLKAAGEIPAASADLSPLLLSMIQAADIMSTQAEDFRRIRGLVDALRDEEILAQCQPKDGDLLPASLRRTVLALRDAADELAALRRAIVAKQGRALRSRQEG